MALRKQINNLFSFVDDPRVAGRVTHKLVDILFIGLCTFLSNGEDYEDMVEFAEQRYDWLCTIIDLKGGIPSHDTFNRVFQIIDPEQFSNCLGEDARLLIGTFRDQLIRLDGKKVRGENPTSRGNAGLYLLNAWIAEHQLCIAQQEVGEKSNEITAIPVLLDRLELEGATVSIDAIGCQVDVAEQIVKQDADYVLSVKKNQKLLFEEVVESFDLQAKHEQHSQWEYDHGRYETRVCSMVCAQGMLNPDLEAKWPSIKTFVRIDASRTENGITSTQSRYYISSHDNKSVEWFNQTVRGHWSIENNLHWHLDVSFNEDASRARRGHAAKNLSTMRKLALNRVKQMSTKLSIRKRRFRASLNLDYLLEMLLQDF